MAKIRYNCPADVGCSFSIDINESGLLGYTPSCWEPELYSHMTKVHKKPFLINPYLLRSPEPMTGRLVSLVSPAKPSYSTRSGTSSETTTTPTDKACLLGGEASSHKAMRTAPETGPGA